MVLQRGSQEAAKNSIFILWIIHCCFQQWKNFQNLLTADEVIAKIWHHILHSVYSTRNESKMPVFDSLVESIRIDSNQFFPWLETTSNNVISGMNSRVNNSCTALSVSFLLLCTVCILLMSTYGTCAKTEYVRIRTYSSVSRTSYVC